MEDKDYTHARNDHLIEKIIKDPLFKINKNGTVFSKITENGQGISDEWREIGYKKKDGYVRFRYEGEFLFVDRVIYRKFNGKLKASMTIDHKDRDKSNNHADNLRQVSRNENNQNKCEKYKKAFPMTRKEIISRIIQKSAFEKEIIKYIPRIISDIRTKPDKVVFILDNFAKTLKLNNEDYARVIELLADKYEVRSNSKIKEQLKILIKRTELHTFLKGLFL